MSEIFEGVVCPTLDRASLVSQSGALGGLSFDVRPAGPDAFVVFRNDPRQGAKFTDTVNHLADALSRAFGKALVVRYDSRIGHRSSVLFEGGIRKHDFGPEQELFVPLDEKGYPLADSSPRSLRQLDPESEYETVCNAIQLGLKALGHGSWDDLFQVMTD